MSEECAELIEVAEGPSVCKHAREPETHRTAVQLDSVYGYKVRVDQPYEVTLSGVRKSLGLEGLEILLELDLSGAPHGVSSSGRPYTMMLLTVPDPASRVIEIDPDAGLLVPIGMVVYEESGGTIIEAEDTVERFAVSGRRNLQELAREIKLRIQDAVDHVASGVTV